MISLKIHGEREEQTATTDGDLNVSGWVGLQI
jgi:hypothetical protein